MCGVAYEIELEKERCESSIRNVTAGESCTSGVFADEQEAVRADAR